MVAGAAGTAKGSTHVDARVRLARRGRGDEATNISEPRADPELGCVGATNHGRLAA